MGNTTTTMPTTAIKKVGNYREVFNGLAEKTSGGLKKKDIIKNKEGRYVSRKRHNNGKKAMARMVAMGVAAPLYKAKKKRSANKKKRRSAGRR